MNFEKSINEIEKIIGYTFKDKSLITQAFTRSSYTNEHKGSGGENLQSNEVLEFFGDSVLSAAIVTLLMKDHSERYGYGIRTEFKEGDFSNIKSRLSDKKNLSDRIRELGLYKYLRMGEGDRKLGIENEPSVMEDLFESIIGAVYIDSGSDLKKVISTVSRMLDVKGYVKRGEAIDKPPIQSFKNALQEFCADKRRRLPAPVYKTVGESGPDHKKVYERACYIGEELIAVGKGKNQKLADADAAEKSLKILASREGGKKPEKKEAIDEGALFKLKKYAKDKKLAPPIFRDLGETDSSTKSRPEFAVACILADKEARASAPDKSSARSRAAAKLLSELTASEAKAEKAKARPRVKKNKKVLRKG